MVKVSMASQQVIAAAVTCIRLEVTQAHLEGNFADVSPDLGLSESKQRILGVHPSIVGRGVSW